MEVVLGLFFIVVAATLGGVLAKYLKMPSLVGYIIAGVLIGVILPENLKSVSSLAEIGTILLLFSIGVELSFDSLSRFFKVAVFGSLIQITLVTLGTFFALKVFGINPITALILSLGFSLSSTAVVVKILSDRGEIGTIHGEIAVAKFFPRKGPSG